MIKERKTITAIVVCSIALTLFCAGSSPIINYVTTDSSIFYVVGRAIKNGCIPYVDIVDHKGIYLFLINEFFAIVSNEKQIGLFYLESIFSILTSLSVYGISKYFLDRKKTILSVFVFMLCWFNYFSYQGGNTIDNYAAALLLFSYYIVLCYGFNKKAMFILGVLAAFVSQLRFSSILPWGGIALTILFLKKSNKEKAGLILSGLGGIVIGLLPCTIYCLVTGCMHEMLFYSLTFNTLYSSQSDTNLFLKFLSAFFASKTLFITLVSLFSVVLVVIKKKNNPLYISIFLSYPLTLLSISLSGYNFGHYYQILVPYFLIFIINILHKLSIKDTAFRCILVIMVLTIVFNLRLPLKIFNKSLSQEYVRFAERCNYVLLDKFGEDYSMLITGSNPLYYNKCGKLPNIKYFSLPAISREIYSYPVEEQIQSIESLENKVIIAFYTDSSFDSIYGFDGERNAIRAIENNYSCIEKNDRLFAKLYVKNEY